MARNGHIHADFTAHWWDLKQSFLLYYRKGFVYYLCHTSIEQLKIKFKTDIQFEKVYYVIKNATAALILKHEYI